MQGARGFTTDIITISRPLRDKKGKLLIAYGNHRTATYWPPFPVTDPMAASGQSSISWNRQAARTNLGFSDNPPRIFVVAYREELRMPKLVAAGPLREIDANDNLRLHPEARLHFLGG
jgi:hypothetical protein